MKITWQMKLVVALGFSAVFVPALALTYFFNRAHVFSPEFNGIATLAIFVLSGVSVSTLYSRLLTEFAPLRAGSYLPNEIGARIVLSVIFDMCNRGWLSRTGLMPIGLRPLLLQALGAQVGRDVHLDGYVFDPQFMSFGDRVILGHNCSLGAHCREGDVLEFAKVTLEDDVTIGVNAILAPGVHIGKGAVIAAASVVAKGTVIPAGETWGGIPARKLKSAPAQVRLVG